MKRPKLKEKRSSVRLNFEVPLTYTEMLRYFWLLRKRGKQKMGIATKPSMYGIRVCGDDAFTEGHDLEMNVELNKIGLGQPCTIQGEILWTRFNPKTGKHEAGLQIYDTGKGMKLWKHAIALKLRSFENEKRDERFDPV